MAGSRIIKNRIRSTKSIQQITKAMQAVSAVKMRKSESAAIKGRPFALYALNILKKIEKGVGVNIKTLSPLFRETPEAQIKKTCLVVIASDKGLAGSFNSNVLKKAAEFVKNSTHTVEVITVGKKAKEFFIRKGMNPVESFEGAGDYATLAEALPISNKIISLFEDGTYDKVDVIYTNFVSALKQDVVHRPLLPLNEATLNTVIDNIVPETGRFSELKSAEQKDNTEYKFEPTPEKIVRKLVPTLVELEVFHSILEANASEHASRMVAMKNASENAKEMIGKLTIKYNKERQAQITKELIEITSGKEALATQEA